MLAIFVSGCNKIEKNSDGEVDSMVMIRVSVSKEEYVLLDNARKLRGLCLAWNDFFLITSLPEKYDPLFNKDISRREKAIMNVLISLVKTDEAFKQRLDVQDAVLIDIEKRIVGICDGSSE